MALKEAWKRCPRVHCIFFLMCSCFMVYSNLSDSVARSLIACDEPVNGTNFTGSARCGDRLLVIERGQELSAAAKAVRLAVAVASGTVLGAVADIRGRKTFMLTYLTAMLVSVACVGFTSSLSANVAWLGYMGSGAFAGFFSIDQNGYRLILADIADESKSALGDLYQAQAFVQAVGSASGIGMSVLVTSLHLTNYSLVCVPIAAVMIVVIALVVSMEETRPESKRGTVEQQSVVETLKGTVALFRDNDYMRRKLPLMLCGGVVESFGPVLGPFTMAVYGWEQEAAGKMIVMGAFGFFLALGTSMPIARKVGERRAVRFCLWVGMLMTPLLVMLPLSPWLLHLTHVCLILSQTLPRCLISAVDMQLTDEDIRARFTSLLSVCKMLIGIIMQPIVAWLFDATAKDYFTQVRPMIVLAVFVFATNFMQLFQPLGKMYGDGLDRITEERLAKAAAAEKVDGAAEAKKDT